LFSYETLVCEPLSLAGEHAFVGWFARDEIAISEASADIASTVRMIEALA
jgi:hypothetical protein